MAVPRVIGKDWQRHDSARERLDRVSAPPQRSNVDYRLEHFVLDPEGAGKVDVAKAITDTNLALTVEGASTLELVVLDEGLHLLRGDLLTDWAWGVNNDDRDEKHWIKDGRAIDAQLDDLWFRLVNVKKEARDTLRLVFEDRIVAKFRAQRGPKKVYRDSDTTRAMFVAQLARGAGLSRDEIHIPELHRKIPIARPQEKIGVVERRKKGHKGITRHLHGVTVKHVKATPQQISILQDALGVGAKLDAPHAAMLAAICAMTAESTVSFAVNSQGYGGPFAGQVNTGGHYFKATDTEAEAWHFFKGGKGFQAGGAIALARKGTNPGEIANLVEAGGAGASFYGKWLPEAKKTLAAFAGGTDLVGGSTDVEVTAAKPFPFARGKNENSWDAIQRLAEEIGFRAFVRKGVFWYASEEYLFNQAPQLDVVEGEDGVDEVLFDIDIGARDLVNEMSVTASAKTWTVEPGMVAMVHRQGPASGRWLVHQAERALHDPQVTVTLNKSIPIKKEPAPETETTSLSFGGGAGANIPQGAASPVAKVFLKAGEISKHNYPYRWGGGHNNSFAPSGSPPGYDCSGYVCACLHAGGLISSPTTSGGLMSWGKPGKGRFFTVYANGEHTFIVFHGLGKFKRADTSPQAGRERRGPHIRKHNRSTAGFVARHWHGL